MSALDEQPLERVTDRLTAEFNGVFEREIVHRVVSDAHQKLLATARVTVSSRCSPSATPEAACAHSRLTTSHRSCRGLSTDSETHVAH